MVVFVSGVSDEVFFAMRDHLADNHRVTVLDAEAWDLWDLPGAGDETNQSWRSDLLARAAVRLSLSGATVLARDSVFEPRHRTRVDDYLRNARVPFCRIWLNRPATAADAPALVAELAI